MQFGPHFEPQASSQGKARPWPKFKFWSFGVFLRGLKTIGNYAFRAFKVGVALHVNLWGPSV